ncbi:hypothetical protein HAX54_025320, partial [Datura stramonium]|nr:hypothetical protein [Datura stramonium]
KKIPPAIKRQVVGPDPRITNVTRDPNSGLKPTVDWTGIPSVFHQTLPANS